MTASEGTVSAVEREIDELRHAIERMNYAYFVLDQPIATDAEYDQRLNRLRALEAEHPDLVTPESPTQRVGSTPQVGFAEIRHPLPMLSLSNVFNEAELRAWAKRHERILPGEDFDFVTEPKIDGLAVALTYVDGRFHHGATRGDGFVGEDISANLRTVRNLPLRLSTPGSRPIPPTIEVRGEIYMHSADFAALNERTEAAGGRLVHESPELLGRLIAPARPPDHRHPAAAALRLRHRLRRGCAWPDIALRGHNLLKELGFQTTPDAELVDTIDDVWARCRALAGAAPRTLDSRSTASSSRSTTSGSKKSSGYVAREPRWATAFKFPAIQQTTKVGRYHDQRRPDRHAQSARHSGAGQHRRRHGQPCHAAQRGRDRA